MRALLWIQIATFRISSSAAFYLRFDGGSHSSYLPKRRSIVLHVEESGDGNAYTNLGADRNRLSLNGPRRRRITHQETRTTAAGAESLFSLSLWSFLKSSTLSIRKEEKASYTHRIAQSDLPSIGCEWACHSDEEKIKLQYMKQLLEGELQVVENNNLHRIYPDVSF